MFRPIDLVNQYVRRRRRARRRHDMQLMMDEMPDWQRKDIGLPAMIAEETARSALERVRSFTMR